MPTVTGATNTGLIYLCGGGQGTAYSKRCLYGDGVITLQSKPIKGSVRKTHSGSGKGLMTLKLKASNTGIVKRVNRGSGKGSMRMALSLKGRGCIKSVVSAKTSRAAVSVVYEPSEGKILKPIYTTTNLSILLSHWGSFLPEISQPVMSHCTKKNLSEQRAVLIEVIKEYLGSDEFRNDRRNWLVARIKYHSCPVMYILNQGWPGVYSPMRFVVDSTAYQHMIHHLFKMVKPDPGGESTYRYSLDGTTLDRIRRLQPEPAIDINRMPPAIKELVNMYGDYDPAIRRRVYGVDQ